MFSWLNVCTFVMERGRGEIDELGVEMPERRQLFRCVRVSLGGALLVVADRRARRARRGPCPGRDALPRRGRTRPAGALCEPRTAAQRPPVARRGAAAARLTVHAGARRGPRRA